MLVFRKSVGFAGRGDLELFLSGAAEGRTGRRQAEHEGGNDASLKK